MTRGAAVAVALLVLLASRGVATSDEANNPAVVAVYASNEAWQTIQSGSGFLVDSRGLVLTNAHLTSAGVPSFGHLLVIVGAEYYMAKVVCQSTAPADRFGRDVAEVQLAPVDLSILPGQPFHSPTLPGDGQPVVAVTPHTAALPGTFPTLALGGQTRVGDTVSVVGYGDIMGGPVRAQHTFSAQVTQVFSAPDGTKIAAMTSAGGRPQAEDSGAPVLGRNGSVVGLWTWFDKVNARRSYAQTGDVLRPACR